MCSVILTVSADRTCVTRLVDYPHTSVSGLCTAKSCRGVAADIRYIYSHVTWFMDNWTHALYHYFPSFSTVVVFGESGLLENELFPLSSSNKTSRRARHTPTRTVAVRIARAPLALLYEPGASTTARTSHHVTSPRRRRCRSAPAAKGSRPSPQRARGCVARRRRRP